MDSHERADMMLVIVFDTAGQLDAAWQHAKPEVTSNVAALGRTLEIDTYQVMHDV